MLSFDFQNKLTQGCDFHTSFNVRQNDNITASLGAKYYILVTGRKILLAFN